MERTRHDDPALHWAVALGTWAIPPAIIDQAPQSPWIHPVESFRPTGELFVDTPSRHRALEALAGVDPSASPTVLDIGCGGGRAAFGLVPPATTVIGVDQQQAMLDVFAAEARSRRVDVRTVLGDWPAVAGATPHGDVVVCHHVVYNVADLVPFVTALTDHARRRVVVELPWQHPLSSMSDAWKHFWDLDRPTTPTAADALAVVRSTGVDARLERFATDPVHSPGPPTDEHIEHTRIRLCLPASRDAEIRDFLTARPAPGRDLATIWWDI